LGVGERKKGRNREAIKEIADVRRSATSKGEERGCRVSSQLWKIKLY
jgi:hypothetical protein